jgi:hypothetical protein
LVAAASTPHGALPEYEFTAERLRRVRILGSFRRVNASRSAGVMMRAGL